MDSLAGFSSEVSLLPWIWIIDYLANFREVDISILRDLIEMAPGIPDDLSKATSERVAFRCLEDLFSDKYNDDVLSATETKIGFATSESCENVLQKILQETSASDLKMAGPELLKWDVGPFLLHKREAMPKCALEQLKDALDASLKESSGLMCGIECNTANVGDVNHSALTMSEKDNSLSSNCENRAGKTGDDLHITNVLTSKRGRDDMAVGCMEGCTNEVQEECDPDNNAKKHKRDAIDNHKPADQISVPTCDKEMVEPVSGRDAAVAGEGSHIANQSHDEGLEERQLPQDDCDNCDDFRKLDQTGDANDVPIQQNPAVDGENVDGVPQAEPVQNETMDEANVSEPRTSAGVPSVGTKPPETVDESRDELEHSRGEETLIVNDEYQDEIVEIAVKKYNFLSSQSSLGHHYSLAMSDCTVQNLCLKCNKGGQLLSCSNSTCPLVVHENCLGFPVRNDEKGNFHCPFCVYTLAISEYNEAKKKASVARKELAAFIKMGSDCYQREFVDGLHRKDSVPSRSNGDLYVGGQENNKGECSHDVSNHLCQIGGANKKGDKGEELVTECLSERGLEGQPVRTSPDSQSDYAKLAGRSRTVTPIDQRDDEGKLQEERVQHASINPPEQLDQGQAEGEVQEEGVERPRINSPKQLDQAEAEGELQEEGVQHTSNPPEQPGIALNSGGKRNSEGAGDKSNYSRPQRKQKQKPNYAYQGPAIPQMRRKQVLWTAKEADMIKKGVRLFATDGDSHNIPWKKILDYGLAVFADGRTTVDLKDKWRRMCKADPLD